MELYSVVQKLTEEEFQELYEPLSKTAEKSAALLKIIRNNPHSPGKQFLNEFDLKPGAFYVLKSRLHARVEEYLVEKMGDPEVHLIKRVRNVPELMIQHPAVIVNTALQKLEKELLRLDFPYGLMTVYKSLQEMHAFDEEKYYHYEKCYKEQVAYTLAVDKAKDLVTQFFQAYDQYYLVRKEEYHHKMIGLVKEITTLSYLYESDFLFIYKAIVHVFAQVFVSMPNESNFQVEKGSDLLERVMEIMTNEQDEERDPRFKSMELMINFLSYAYYEWDGKQSRANRYFDVVNYKIKELLTRYQFNVNTSMLLMMKLRRYKDQDIIPQLLVDLEHDLADIDVSEDRASIFMNLNLYKAYVYVLNGKYKQASRILFQLWNFKGLKKYVHFNLEVSLLLALTYVQAHSFDLANKQISALQRQLRKPEMEDYTHAKVMVKILNIALSGSPNTRVRNLCNYIAKWKQMNVGPRKLLELLELEEIFLQPKERKLIPEEYTLREVIS